ncbi:MAG: hypothetical protein HY047_07995, partial [Acidobacteria bacterium]|nr:hypothetical protein [Acidobacteriota bacterium]
PAIRAAVVGNVQTAALRHFGHTRSSGEFYRALDEKFYAHVSPNAEDGESFALTFDEGLRFLIRSVVAFFAQPLPSSVDSAKWLLMVPLQVVWWGASLLALVGAIRGLWRHPLLASLFVGFIVASVVAIAPNSGNLGTLIRHRDVIMPFVAMLAGLGGVTLAERFVALSDPVLASRDHAVESWP